MGVTMSNSDYTSMSSMPSYSGMGTAPSSSTSSSSSKPDNSSSKSSGSTSSGSSGSSSSSSSSSKPDNSSSKESGSYGADNTGGSSDSESSNIGRMSNSDYGSMSSMPNYPGTGSSGSGSDTARTSLVQATGGLMPSLNSGSYLAGGGYVPMTPSSNAMAVNPVVGVVAAGNGWTQVKYADGTIELRQGDRASRNNNPGNLEYRDWMKDYGAVGSDGRFAVFKSAEDGIKAQSALLGGSLYADKSISDAIKTYAPPNENNSAAYAKSIADKAGVSVDTKMSDLTVSQRDALIAAMHDVEGNTGYSSTVQMAGTIGTGAQGTGSSSPSQSPVSELALNDIPTPTAADRSALPASGGLLAGLSPIGSANAGELVKTSTGYQVPEIVDAVKANPESMTPQEYAAYQQELQRTMQTADYARMPSLPSYATQDYSRYLQGSPQVYDKEATQSAGQPQTSSAETFREKYLEDPWAGTRTADAQPAKAEKPGLGKQIMAGAIDIGAGLIPGVGTAATIFNAGAGLLGKQTIGQRIVNGVGTGTGEMIDTGSSDDSEEPPRIRKPEDENTDPVQSFADKYLKPVLYDGNWQTPAEKWGTA